MAPTLGLAPDLAPIIMPTLTTKITTFAFGHLNSNKLEQGINPFTVGYWNAKETTRACLQATQHTMLLDGATLRLESLWQRARRCTCPRPVFRSVSPWIITG